MEKENKAVDFEAATQRLEKITEALGKDGVKLEEALALYEEGVKLVKECNAVLEATERKIKILQVSADGELAESDFNPTTGAET